MNETLSSVGTACIAVAFLFALAGAGWWRLAVVLVGTCLVAVIAASAVGAMVWRVALSFDHGGNEWRGLGPLMIGVVTTAAVFLLCFVLIMILLAVTKRTIFRRSHASFVMLGISALLLVGGISAFSLNTPRHASTRALVRQLEQTWEFPEGEDELARRGTGTVPVILAELQRLSQLDNNDGYAPHDVPPLLRMLGWLGGAEANAELHRWAASDSPPGILAAAACALAAQGDRSAEELISRFLTRHDGDWPSRHAELLKALEQLKATKGETTVTPRL